MQNTLEPYTKLNIITRREHRVNDNGQTLNFDNMR